MPNLMGMWLFGRTKIHTLVAKNVASQDSLLDEGWYKLTYQEVDVTWYSGWYSLLLVCTAESAKP